MIFRQFYRLWCIDFHLFQYCFAQAAHGHILSIAARFCRCQFFLRCMGLLCNFFCITVPTCTGINFFSLFHAGCLCRFFQHITVFVHRFLRWRFRRCFCRFLCRCFCRLLRRLLCWFLRRLLCRFLYWFLRRLLCRLLLIRLLQSWDHHFFTAEFFFTSGAVYYFIITSVHTHFRFHAIFSDRLSFFVS